VLSSLRANAAGALFESATPGRRLHLLVEEMKRVSTDAADAS
jgi:hypothetical protein